MTRVISPHDRKHAQSSPGVNTKKSDQGRVIVLSLNNVSRFDAERRARYEAAAKSPLAPRDYPSITLP